MLIRKHREFGGITPDATIKGFAGATLLTADSDSTGHLIETIMGFNRVKQEGDRVRYQSMSDLGNMIDVVQSSATPGEMGTGTVHHIAFRAEDDQDLMAWQSYIEKAGFKVTDVKDRHYFKSIYFREKGGILFEIATDPPGFARDEPLETLGTRFMLPKQFEDRREQLQQSLIPIKVREL